MPARTAEPVPELSVVVPIYNEPTNVEAFVSAVSDVLAPLGIASEVVFDAEAGPSHGSVVILLHGWPYDIHAFADVMPLSAGAGYRVLVPSLRGYGETASCPTWRRATANQARSHTGLGWDGCGPRSATERSRA